VHTLKQPDVVSIKQLMRHYPMSKPREIFPLL
jgi:hypothetical protein